MAFVMICTFIYLPVSLEAALFLPSVSWKAHVFDGSVIFRHSIRYCIRLKWIIKMRTFRL